ncbi:hypothetical protein ACISU4_11420 [Streptomyces wuyuanensis]|uniref:hypothetical protein n=1 Tax=Streptomyces wuyuanensis TaxID=1196353 RepID=UPI003825A1CE
MTYELPERVGVLSPTHHADGCLDEGGAVATWPVEGGLEAASAGRPADGVPLFAEAESRRATEWESVLLVGNAATIAAARRWHETVWSIELLVREGETDAEMCAGAHGAACSAGGPPAAGPGTGARSFFDARHRPGGRRSPAAADRPD